MTTAKLLIKANFTDYARETLGVAGIIVSPGSAPVLSSNPFSNRKEFKLSTGLNKNFLTIAIKDERGRLVGLNKHYKLEMDSDVGDDYKLDLRKTKTHWKISISPSDQDGEEEGQQTTNVTVSDDGEGG
jgi:hypothetical protein